MNISPLTDSLSVAEQIQLADLDPSNRLALSA